MATVEVLRAYRVLLDPAAPQQDALARHAGAARWAYNHALAAKLAARQQWLTQVRGLVDAGVDEAAARAHVRVPTPTKPTIQKALNAVKGDSRAGVDGLCPWWHEVSTYALQSAMADADTAWANWVASRAGKRAGRPVRMPRYKSRRRSRWSFRLHHDVRRPTIRLESPRRLLLPRIGSVRLAGHARRLWRAVRAGRAVVQSVTVSRAGRRWYAAILVKEQIVGPDRPSRAQQAAGTVGVNVGVHHLAALSTGEVIRNPRHARSARRRLQAAQRALARTQRGSARREKARARVARLSHLLAERRATTLHSLTKRLVTGWAVVAVENLNVAGMTSSARGTRDRPGRRVRQKAGLNRSVLDVAPGELRRQLAYKTCWYGSTLAVVDRFYPSSKTCSACGAVKPKLSLAERVFTCGACMAPPIDRDVNAAISIAAAARHVASDRGETQNARRADIRPAPHPVRAVGEDAGRPATRGSPPPSNRRTIPAA